MKNYKLLFKFGIVALIFGFAISSCENEFDNTVESLETSEEGMSALSSYSDPMLLSRGFEPQCRDAASILGSIALINGILNFTSVGHYENCVKCLEDAQENHLLAFENSTSLSSPEELDSLEDATGFSYFGALEAFENSKGFKSRRQWIENQIIQWLDSQGEEIDFSNDPDELDSFSEEERTLMSRRGQISISGNVINLLQLVEVDDLTRENDVCQRFNKTREFEEYVSRRRIKTKLVNSSYPWKVKIKSKIVHYRRRNNKWKRRRGRIATACLGIHALNNCVGNEPLGDFAVYRNRKSRKAKRTVWGVESWRQHRCGLQDANFGVRYDGNEYLFFLNH